jgi:hypothetical protein
MLVGCRLRSLKRHPGTPGEERAPRSGFVGTPGLRAHDATVGGDSQAIPTNH